MAKFTVASYDGNNVISHIEGNLHIEGRIAIFYTSIIPTNEGTIAAFDLKQVFILKEED